MAKLLFLLRWVELSLKYIIIFDFNDLNRYNTVRKGSRGPKMVLDIRQHSNALGI